MAKERNANPTYLLSKDPKALEWLDKYKDDLVIGGGFSTATPFHNFTKVLNFDRQPVVDALRSVSRRLSRAERTLVALFLKMPPREIAKKLNVPTEELYCKLRSLRDKAIRLSAEKRESFINQRSRKLTPDLETEPKRIARRTIEISKEGKVAYCYLVERDDRQVWVDESGKAFGREIQSILSNIEEDQEGFTVLHAEKY
jgi:hypothetical protein